MSLLDWFDPDRYLQEQEDPAHGNHEGPDYEHGYSHGREKAHWEIRNHDLNQHEPSCDCLLCITVTCVLMQHNLDPRADR